MSDLISRSALIEILEDYENDDWNKKLCTMLPNVVDDCIEFIENQTTVYDIDKVISELEKLADESYKSYCIYFNSDDRAEYDAYINAIEIIKQGGVSDD